MGRATHEEIVMWQEIIVGLVVAVSAIFVVRRFWKNFTRLRDDAAPSCGCCSSCGQAPRTGSDCGGSAGTGCDAK
ncbi:MAG: FeoB-associated Cys-rich membrane protein [Deltaproteobacteria bacterium]|nr:FeoB-associated Cys-rich membrane protein [Deltaproteobacteria bacterium]